MMDFPPLIGMEEEKALRAVHSAGLECRVIHYSSPRPVEHPDSARVVRVTEHQDALELLICEFRTDISQG